MSTNKPVVNTPGPWTVVEHSWARTGIYAKHIAVAALDIGDEATEETQEEWEGVMAANARLIAAAPDLLEVVQALLLAQATKCDPALVMDENSPIMDAAREALKKARG